MKDIAVLGAGYWGKNLIRNFHELGNLKSIFDQNLELLSAMKESYPEINIHTEILDVLTDDDIKGVVIALPAEFHFQYAAQCLLHNKDVFVEKPLALDVRHAEELIKLAKIHNRILMVGHLLQYHSAFIKLKELFSSGELGRIQYIYSNRLSLGKIRREENALWSFAPHDISMILSLAREVPEHVYCEGGNYLHQSIADVTMTHLSFPCGIKAHIFVSWLHPFKEQKLIVVADKKMAVFEDTQPWEKKIALYSHSVEWKMGMPIPKKADAEYVNIEPSEPLKAECQHFLECINTRQPPITDGKEGLNVLNVLEKAQKSLKVEVGAKTKGTETAEKYFVHETSCVDQPCEIGEGTKIWHFSHVLKNSIIGKNCILGQNVNIANNVRIGDNVKIQNNVSIYTGTEIEDDVFLGPSCVLTNVNNPRAQVKRHSLYEKTVIRRGATVCANATLVCGTEIGRYAFIAAGAVVTKDIPDYAFVSGVPAKKSCWMSRHGHKLAKPDKDGVMTCPESGLRYKEESKDMLRCIDLPEEQPLPEELSVGKVFYKELKN